LPREALRSGVIYLAKKNAGSNGMLDMVSMALLLVGGLNWGLIALADFDLVATLFGDMTMVSRLVYALVGAAAVYVAVMWLPKAMK
jgi:uncharacterized membrane protein YuzA (DUF378 family)